MTRNEQFDNLEATTQFTDPSGKNITGEVATAAELAASDAVVQVPEDFASIQAAVDSLPANGGTVLIDEPNYDPLDDTLPISLTDEPPKLVGTAKGDQLSDGLDFTGNTNHGSQPVFDINITSNWRIGVTFEHLHIRGGQDVIRINGGCFLKVIDCWLQDATRDGIHQTATGEGLYSYVESTVIEEMGQDGINFSNAADSLRPNACHLNHVIARDNARHGAWLRAAGAMVSAGSYESNDGSGIKVGTNDSKTSASVLGTYFEHNGISPPTADDDADLQLYNGGNQACYVAGVAQSTAGTPAANGIYGRTGEGHQVVGVKGPRDAVNIRIGSGTTNMNVDYVADTSTLTVDAGATRPRVGEIIGGGPIDGVDLSTTTGEEVGDLAIADGTSPANAGDLARWNGTVWDVFQPATTV